MIKFRNLYGVTMNKVNQSLKKAGKDKKLKVPAVGFICY